MLTIETRRGRAMTSRSSVTHVHQPPYAPGSVRSFKTATGLGSKRLCSQYSVSSHKTLRQNGGRHPACSHHDSVLVPAVTARASALIGRAMTGDQRCNRQHTDQSLRLVLRVPAECGSANHSAFSSAALPDGQQRKTPTTTVTRHC
jgi:hypothetical protein